MSLSRLSPSLKRLAQASLVRHARVFSSAAVHAPAATDEKEKKYLPVLEEYSVWPLIGFGGAVAIAKEWVIINEEAFVATLMFSAYFSLYTVLREPWNEYAKNYINSTEQAMLGSFDDKIAVEKSKIEYLKSLKDLPKLVENIADYRYELANKAIYYKVARAKAERTVATRSRLDRISAFEVDLVNRRLDLQKKIVRAHMLGSVTSKLTDAQLNTFNQSLVEFVGTEKDESLKKVTDWIAKEVKNANVEIQKGAPEKIRKQFSAEITDLERAEKFFTTLVSKMD